MTDHKHEWRIPTDRTPQFCPIICVGDNENCHAALTTEEAEVILNEHASLKRENERLTEMLGDDAIVSFVNTNGGREVHRSWRDNMLHQGRRVKPELMEWGELPIYDQVLDRAISLDVLRDYAVWTLGHHTLASERASDAPREEC